MKENGSQPSELETNGDRSYFLISLSAHPKVESKESARADTKGKTSEKSSEKTSGKIFTEICNNRNVTIAELSELVGITTRSVERNLKKLQVSGLLKRIGSAKGGYWLPGHRC
jgi:predicted HTH transcriptional regulator